MKRSIYALVLSALFFAGCTKQEMQTNALKSNSLMESSAPAEDCECIESPEEKTANIIKFNTATDVGDLTVWNDNDKVYVKIEAIGLYDNTKVYIGACSGVPSNSVNYPNAVSHSPKVNSYTYTFDNTYSACEEICIAVRVGGISNGGGNGLVTMSYKVREICVCDIQVGDYTTYSKGGFSNNNGNGAGTTAMTNNWSSIGSVSIGCGNKSKTFNSASDVTAYLPNGRTSGPNGGVIAPFTSNQEAALATQVLALTINVALDARIGCLVVDTDSTGLDVFNGMSVNDIISLANDVLGGCNSSYTLSQMTAICDALNLNFHEGTVNEGIVTCGDCD